MDVRVNYVCGICQKAFTKNSSLKRHKTIVHLSTRFNCLTCTKTYRRREDLIKHSRICLMNKLEDNDSSTNDIPSQAKNSTPQLTQAGHSTPVSTIMEDLTLSDSDEVISQMGKKVENQLLSNSMSRQTNTEISCLEMVDKATNTEPLIVISPDEILDLGNKLSLLTFDKNLKIFVDTLNSEYNFCKPKMSRCESPTTQIGLLAAQPAACKGSQTKSSPEFPSSNQPTLLHVPDTLLPSDESAHDPPTQDSVLMDTTSTPAPKEPKGSESLNDTPVTPTATPTMEEMCQRKPTRPSLFIPPCKRNRLAAVLKKN